MNTPGVILTNKPLMNKKMNTKTQSVVGQPKAAN